MKGAVFDISSLFVLRIGVSEFLDIVVLYIVEVIFFEQVRFWGKSSASGSEAAPDK